MSRLRSLKCLIASFLLAPLLLIATPSNAAFLTFVEVVKDGVNGVDGLLITYSVAASPDGKHIYAAGLEGLTVFSRNAASGKLTFAQVLRDGVGGVDGLAGAHTLVISADGKHVYVASETDKAVAVFSRNATSGVLTFVEAQKDGIGGVDGLDGSRSLVVSPDGKHVYVAGATDNAVAVFSRNATSGALTFVEAQKDGVGGVDGLGGVRSVAVAPDGKHVYAAGYTDNAVAVFSRNATSGALTFVQMQQDGAGSVDGLEFTTSVTVSPDNRHVYATGIASVVIFGRNTTTGALSFVGFKRDDLDGIDGLGGAAWVMSSPDGQHVYVAGGNDDMLAVFSRNSITGVLTFVEVRQDGVGGVDGLDFIQSVAVSPDNLYVYAAGAVDNAVAVFRAGSTSPPITPTRTRTVTATSTRTATPSTTPGRRTGYLPLIAKPLPVTATPTPTVPPTVTPTHGPTATLPPSASGRIVFSSNRDGNNEIYIMNANGSGQARLTNNPAHDTEPAWSPDGTHIAFVSNRDGNNEIYIMNANGSGATRLTNNSAGDYSPAWSPDNTRIAFGSYRDSNDEIYLMNANGSGQINLTKNTASDYGPAWSPDSTHIVFASSREANTEIYTMNADGSEVNRLTNNITYDYDPHCMTSA